jgi:hypothetical protein
MAAWLRNFGIALVAATLSLVWTGGAAEAASTTSYQLMLQSRSDTAAPNEVYLASFASLDDVFSQTIGAPTGFTQIEITPGFEITGMTKDDSGFRVLLQSRADTAAPGEVYLASFNSLDDIFSQTIGSPSAFTQIEVTPNFQIAGLTWDGTGYRMLLQSRLDAAAPNEVYLASFATLDDIFSQTIGSPTAFTQIEITPGFRIADFTWDGSGYRMLLQSRLDAAAPNEVYLASFATLDDLLTQTIGGPTGFTQLEITPNFRIVGFSSVTTMDPLPPGVPEPMSWALLIIGFGATGAVMRGRRQFA